MAKTRTAATKKSGGGRKAAAKPRRAKKPRIRSHAENAGGGRPGSLAEKLGKAFALTNCKRLVAIAEERNRALSRLSELAETKKAVAAELAETPAGTEWNKLACQKVRIEEEQDKLRQIRLTSVTDVFRLVMECAGGTLFEAAEEQTADRTGGDDGKGGIFDGQGAKAGEHVNGDTGEIAREPRTYAAGA